MGVDYFTHCGTYVECKVKKTTGAVEKQRCSNTSCDRHKVKYWPDRYKFCTECGQAIETVNVTVEVDAVDSWELQEDLDGDLWQPFGDYEEKLREQGLHIWIGGKTPDANDRPAACY